MAAELATWNLYLEMHTSRGTEDTQTEHLHPRVIYLLQRKEKLSETSKKLKLRQAYRPDKLQVKYVETLISGIQTRQVTKLAEPLLSLAFRPDKLPVKLVGILLSVAYWQTLMKLVKKILPLMIFFFNLIRPV